MEAKDTKVGWIGTGNMGNGMVQHLINKGYQVMVYNRTASKADNLVQMGAKFLSPQEIA